MTDAVLTDDAGGVLVITINRPEARNAVNAEVARGIAAAMDALDTRDDLNVGVITGAGSTSCAVVAGAAAWPAGEFWDRQRVIVEPVFTSGDAREGALAFAEKRPPRWTGR